MTEQVTEFVVFNSEGKEIDWIDPVRSYTEDDDQFVIDNHFSPDIVIEKIAGQTYEFRQVDGVDPFIQVAKYESQPSLHEQLLNNPTVLSRMAELIETEAQDDE